MTAQETLNTWLSEGQSARDRLTRGPGPGVIHVEHLSGKSGLEVMQAMQNGEVPHATIGATLNFMPLEIERGRALFQGQPGPEHLNPMGTVHGGWFATVLDSALGCAVHSMLPAGRGYTTAELSVNIVKALTPKAGPVRAEGKVLHCGRQLATAEARLFGADGTLYAHATTTCLVFELPKKA